MRKKLIASAIVAALALPMAALADTNITAVGSTALLPLVAAIEGGEPDLGAATGVTALNCQAGGYLAYARAVMLGRAGRRLEAVEAARLGDRHLAQMPWYRHLVRRLAAEAAITRDRADRELRRRFGQSETARQRQVEEAAARRESELAAGHGEIRFAGFVTVSGRDPEDLRRACAEVSEHAARARIELHRMYGQQATAFTFTLPLCRGLR